MRIGQSWSDEEGQVWRVANVHRKDACVHLEIRAPHDYRAMLVTFGELARHYELTGEQPRGP